MPQAFDFGKSTLGTDTFQYAGSVAPIPPSYTGASIKYIQDNHGNSSNASVVTVTLSSNVIAGDFLAAAVCLPSTASVESITDNLFGRWIQTAYSYTAGGNAELWTCRGAEAGSLTVTVTLTALSTTGVNISEWANVWTAAPLDQWSQNYGTSAGPQATQLQPRAEGELIIGVVSTTANVTHIPTGFTALTESGSSGYSADYRIMAGASVAVSPIWATNSSASTWAVAAATFINGPQMINPHYQFPECFVQISTTNNFLAPLEGTGVWTDFSGHVRNMTIGPLGRQHELDRVQATTAQITCNNRIDGAFNPWNSSSFLYNNGLGLKPMNPIRVCAAWLGVTSPVFYGYLQAVDPGITDVLNVDAQIAAVDILQMMSLAYLSSDNYAKTVVSDGGANLAAYYRLGDMPGSYSVKDSSGNGNTGSLISGPGGPPAYGADPFFLYDSDTALDLTNGTNAANGGFATVDNMTQPPTNHYPLGSASEWTFECWLQWTGSTTTTPGFPSQFSGYTTSGQSAIYFTSLISGPPLSVGDGVTGPNVAAGTVITSLFGPGVNQGYDAVNISQPIGEIGDVTSTFTGVTNAGQSAIYFTTLSSGPALAVGDTVSGANIPIGTTITGLGGPTYFNVVYISNPASTTDDTFPTFTAYANAGGLQVFEATGGEVGSTLFTAITTAGEVDIRVGTANTASQGSLFNRVTIGTVSGGMYTILGQSINDTVQDGGWNHLVVTYESSTVSIYINGNFDSAWGIGPAWLHPSDIFIGCNEESMNGFVGILDEVALYTTVLTSAQILSHYKTGLWFQSVETAFGVGPTPRLKTICNVVGFPLIALNSPYNWVTELYGETESLVNTSALNYIQTITETEPGLIFQGPNGTLNAYNRQYQYLNETSIVSQATIADSSSTSYHYDGPSLQIVSDDLDVWNDIQVQSGIPESNLALQQEIGILQEWGPVQSPQAAVSASVYGSRTLQGLTALQMAYNSDALAIAQNYGAWYNVPLVRVTQMTLGSTGNGGVNLVQMLSRGLYDRLTVEYQGQTAGPIFSQDSLIEQITHTVVFDGGPYWNTQYSMSPYEILLTPFIFGNSSQSQLGGSGFTPPQVLTL